MNLRRIKKYKNLERIFYLNFKFRRVNSTLISSQTKIMSCELRYWSMEIGLKVTKIPYDTDLVNKVSQVDRFTRGIGLTVRRIQNDTEKVNKVNQVERFTMGIGLTVRRIPNDADKVNTATRVKGCTRGILMTKVAYNRDPLFPATRVVSRL